MSVHVTCKLDKDPTKIKGAIVFTTFFSGSQGASNSKVTGWIWPEFELIRDCTYTCPGHMQV